MTGMTRGRERATISPPEGWLTLALVLLMSVTLAWAVDDARVVLGRAEITDFLMWTAVGGVLFGFIGPRAGWGRWTTFLIGAIFAALVTPLLVGGTLATDTGIVDPPFGLRMELTARAAVGAFADLVLLSRQTTVQIGHHLLILGLIIWGSSMFASYAVFGHRRPLNAVILLGALLVGNAAFTSNDQLVYFVIFTLASLFLLIRMHTFEEQTEWLRRRIGDPSTIAGLYLRGGTIFIGVTVLSALLLTKVAASAPLAGAWRDVGGRFIDWSQAITRYLPQSGTGVALGPQFQPNMTISGSWFTSDQIALTIEIPDASMGYEPYWRNITYDLLTFDGFGTTSASISTIDREANAVLLEDTGDAVEQEGRREVTFRITPAVGDDIYAPQTPVAVDVPTEVQLLGEGGFFATANRGGGNGGYSVTSWVPVMGDDTEGALTQNRLRSAGTDYPDGILERYAVANPPEIIGPNVLTIRDEILQERPGNAFDLAADTVRYLQDPDVIQYDANVIDDWGDCPNSRIECFAEFRKGYCQHYAALMTAIMRDQGYPARVVQGFLPGDRSIATHREEVRNNRAHAWVEVYFPGYGWVDFDPTGGSLGRQISVDEIPQGAVQPSGSPGASSSVAQLTRPPEPSATRGEPPGSGGIVGGGSPVGPLIAVAFLLAVIMGSLALMAWRRGPRGPVSADSAYGMLTTWASRFGFGPRPNQTVYEYAGSLAEILPNAKPELETVARAKVEVAYGGRRLGLDRILSLREAQKRLRVALVRLAFRRDLRRQRRRR